MSGDERENAILIPLLRSTNGSLRHREESTLQRSRLSMIERHRAHLASEIKTLQAEVSRLQSEVTRSVGILDSLQEEVARLKKELERTSQSRLRFQKKSRCQSRENKKLRAEVSCAAHAGACPAQDRRMPRCDRTASKGVRGQRGRGTSGGGWLVAR